MNMWNSFINLDFNGKVVAIVLYILGVLLVILWAKFITKRFKGGVLLRFIVSSPKQEMENAKNASSRCHKSEEMCKPLGKTIIWQQLLSKICNSIGDGIFHYIPKNKRDSQKPYISLAHINRILARRGKCQSIKNRTPGNNKTGKNEETAGKFKAKPLRFASGL